MGQYNKAVLTTAGEKLIARALAGEVKLDITKAKTSSYIYPSGTDFKSLTDLKEIKQAVADPTTTVYSDTMIQTRVLFSNEDIAFTYYINNVGLYVMDGTQEVLFCIVTAETPDEMPQYNGVAATSYIYNIQNVVQDATELNITVNSSGTATIQDVLERVDATGGDISETVIENLDTIEDKYPVPVAGESVKRFFGKLITFMKNIKPLTSDSTFYVSVTGSDTTGDGSQFNPYATITRTLSVIPKNLNGFNCIISIDAGLYDESVKISDFKNGKIQLAPSGSITISDLTVSNSYVFTNSGTMSTGWIYVINRGMFDLYSAAIINVTAYRTYGGNNISIMADFASNIYMSGTVVLSGNTDIAVVSVNNSRVYLGNIRGSGLATGFLANTGGTISHASNNIVATKLYETVNGGIINKSSGVIAGTLDREVNYYVSTTGSDTTGDGSITKPFRTIQHTIDVVPKNLGGCAATINIASGVYEEDVYVLGFTGGSLNLYSDTKDTQANTCKVRSITMSKFGTGYLRVNGFNFTTTSREAIVVTGCNGVHIRCCQITGATSTWTGAQVNESFCNFSVCKVANRNHGVSYSNSTGVSMDWDAGSTGNVVGISSFNGSRVVVIGSGQPIGTTDSQTGNGGTFVYNNGTQITGIITSGISCSWGGFYGGYVKDGVVGTSMVTISLQVSPTVALSAFNIYRIYGFPKPSIGNVCVQYSSQTVPANCYMENNGAIVFQPATNVPLPSGFLFSATYLTNT